MLPFFISLIISGNDYFGVINQGVTKGNDWIGFAGGYIGGTISGIITYIGVRLTIKNNNESIKTQQKLLQRTLLTAEIGSSPFFYNTNTSMVAVSSSILSLENTKIIHNTILESTISRIQSLFGRQSLSEDEFNHYSETGLLPFNLYFLTIKNPDQSNALNCRVNISFNEYDINEGISLVQPGETFIIPINEPSETPPIPLERIEITYITKLGEKMKLYMEIDVINNTINPTYYVLEDNNYIPIFRDDIVHQSIFSPVQTYQNH